MSALRYYDLPFDQTAKAPRQGLIDRLCAALWSWAVERQRSTAAPSLDPHILRDIGLTDVDLTRN